VAERFVAILAGGSGTRLWPLSRADHPKQLLDLIGGGSLLRSTLERVLPLVPPEQVFILTERSHAAEVRTELAELPAQNILVEPARRGTAGALATAAAIIARRAPDAVWASLHSDAFIADDEAFRGDLSAAFEGAAELPHLFTLGIQPTYPSPDFGYIQAAEVLRQVGDRTIRRVARFVEKPKVQEATEYLASGHYFWNPGVFVWSARAIVDQFADLLPEIWAPLERLAAHFGGPSFESELQRIYPSIPEHTIDQGIMERAPRVAVIPASFGWNDIGSWKELYAVLSPEAGGNVVRADHVGIDTSGTLVFGGKRLVATVGLEDLVIVDTDDALFICTRERAVDVREVVEELRRRGRNSLL
jgi:mannose-1-phosphate guanylyltransferase